MKIDISRDEAHLLLELLTKQARLEALIGRISIALAKPEEPKKYASTEWVGKIKYDPARGIHPPISNGILIKDGPSASYQVFVRSQDSTEYIGEFCSIEQARNAWVDGSRTFGAVVIEDDAPFCIFEDGRYVSVDP